MEAITTAGVYLRKSSVDKRPGENKSIADQRHDLEQLAERHGFKIVAKYEEAEGTSASSFKDHDRPQYERAMAAMGRDYDVLLAWQLDRLTREGSGPMAHLLDLIDSRGGRVITTDGCDLKPGGERISPVVRAEIARQEMVELSSRVRRGKAGQRRRGEYQGGSVGYGLMAKRSLDGPTVLVLDHDAKAVITEMAEMIVGGATLMECCRWAAQQGHRTNSGGNWEPPVLSKFMRSAHLIGHQRQLDDVHRDESGEPVVVTEPILTEALFRRVDKAIRSRRKHPGGKRVSGKSPTSLLASLAKCGSCGSGMRRQSPTERHGRTYLYYECPAAACDAKARVRLQDLEDHVAREALLNLAKEPDDSEIVAEVGRRWLAMFTPEQNDRRGEVAEELAKVEGSLSDLRRDYYERKKMPESDFERIEANLQIRANTLATELATLPEPQANLQALMDLAQSSDDPEADIVGEGSAWKDLQHHERRAIMACLVDEVVVARAVSGYRGNDDIAERTTVTLATASNVVELGARTERSRRSTAPKLAHTA